MCGCRSARFCGTARRERTAIFGGDFRIRRRTDNFILTGASAMSGHDYSVADIGLAEWGDRQLYTGTDVKMREYQ